MRQQLQTQSKHMECDPVDYAVEVICCKGCKAVWQDIDELEAGGPLVAYFGLSRFESKRVVAELKSVMATYSYRCKPE